MNTPDADIDGMPLDTVIDRRELRGRVAVIGYPNVGKSTLVNRLSGTRTAIVHDEPGVTRDRKEVVCEWNGMQFLLVDTGGIDAGDPRPMARQVLAQAELAITEADLVVLVVDGSEGISAADIELADKLRRAHMPVIVAANKLDDGRRGVEALEFWQLDLGEPIAVSAHHGTNTGDLLDTIVETLRELDTTFTATAEEAAIKICVLGRPNVGKSTLVNALLDADRSIVSEVAGTTRDSIDTPLRFLERDLILVDTAGIRRRGSRRREPVEYYGEVRALQAADRADVAVLLVDASEGIRDSDLAIGDEARSRHCSLVVCLSKWDINNVDLGDVQQTLSRKLRQRPEVLTLSARTGRNVERVLKAVLAVHDRASQRVATGPLNAELREIVAARTPPSDKRSRRRLNMLYATQYQVAPPRIRIFVNDRSLVTRDYGYYLENQLRERFDFAGCPLIIDFKDRR